MVNFINKALEAARKYTVWDYGTLKVCLFTLGLLVGQAFPPFPLEAILGLVILFVLSYAWLVYLTFFRYWR